MLTFFIQFVGSEGKTPFERLLQAFLFQRGFVSPGGREEEVFLLTWQGI
jgi:hypothetical protein